MQTRDRGQACRRSVKPALRRWATHRLSPPCGTNPASKDGLTHQKPQSKEQVGVVCAVPYTITPIFCRTSWCSDVIGVAGKQNLPHGTHSGNAKYPGVGPLREALCVSLGARERAGGEMGASVLWAVETGSQVFAGAGLKPRLLSWLP